MDNWKVGDIAICINNVNLDTHIEGYEGPRLRLNAEYIVQGVYQCKCARLALDIGLNLSEDEVIICFCGRQVPTKSEIRWCDARRFVKKDTRTLEEQLEEALENEDYERVSIIQKQINN
jgi:hypothetical protein